LWTHTRGGFYHDGRFATLRGVNHYDAHFGLLLSDREKDDRMQRAGDPEEDEELPRDREDERRAQRERL